MKIVTVLGSPRPTGNSTGVAVRFCDVAERLGAEVRTYALNKLKFRGCQGCMTCKTKLDRCVIEDDLTAVLQAVGQADLLLMASPIYFGDVSSQLKAFIDRTFSFLLPDYATNSAPSRLAPGKILVFVLAQGNPDDNRFDDVFPKYESFFRWYGFDNSHLLRVCGVREPGEAEGRAKTMQRAEALANLLCGGDTRLDSP